MINHYIKDRLEKMEFNMKVGPGLLFRGPTITFKSER